MLEAMETEPTFAPRSPKFLNTKESHCYLLCMDLFYMATAQHGALDQQRGDASMSARCAVWALGCRVHWAQAVDEEPKASKETIEELGFRA